MNLLFPQFLYGLLALAIPIIIHLFNFRRTKKVYFSNNRFLKNIKESNSSRIKLKHLLVLFSRLLFILFLVLSFAQPYLSSEEDLIPNDIVKVYVDNSYSMSNRTDSDLSGLDQALIYSESIVSQYPKSTKFQLFTNEFDISSEAISTNEAFLDALTEVKLSPITRSLNEIVGRMNSTNENYENNDEDHFLLSDFQKSTISGFSRSYIDTLINYSVVPITFSSHANLFVDSIYLSNPFLLKDNSNKLLVSIRNTGNARVEDVIVKLLINNEQVATAGLSIDANTSAITTFDINFSLQNKNSGVISFEDFPVAFDNTFYFTLNSSRKINIVALEGNNASRALSQVYADSSIFEFSAFDMANFDYNVLKGADLVFINEVEFINQTIRPYLQDFLDNGGYLVIIFGEQPSLEDYEFLNVPERFSLANNSNNLVLKSLNQPDFNNPFFENIFDESVENIEMPGASNTVYWKTLGTNILKYRDDNPFLSRSERDNIFFIGAPLKDKFTSFHKQAIFVPIMYRLAALSLVKNEKLYYEISDSQIQLRKEAIEATDIIKLRRDEMEIVPSQYAKDNTIFMEIPKYTLSPGFYNIVKGEDSIKSVAFNFNREESFLTQIDENEIEEMFEQTARIYAGDDLESFQLELKEKFTGKQLWKYCLVLALFFLLVEIAFIRLL